MNQQVPKIRLTTTERQEYGSDFFRYYFEAPLLFVFEFHQVFSEARSHLYTFPSVQKHSVFCRTIPDTNV